MRREFDNLERVASDSRLCLALVKTSTRVAAAWDDSRLAQVTREAKAGLVSLPATGRVRLAALTLAWAGAGHLAFLWFSPRYVSTGLPRTWIAVAAGTALLIAFAADEVTKAWRESVVAKALVRPGRRS